MPLEISTGGKPDVNSLPQEWQKSSFRIENATYVRLAGVFNPILFDAEEWVRLAVESGMQYLVVTSKHHDGFAISPPRLRRSCGKWAKRSAPIEPSISEDTCS